VSSVCQNSADTDVKQTYDDVTLDC